MGAFQLVDAIEVDKILRTAKLKPSRELPKPTSMALAPRTPGFLLEQPEETTVHVRWHGRPGRYLQERLDRAAAALEGEGLRVQRLATGRGGFYLEVWRRGAQACEPG